MQPLEFVEAAYAAVQRLTDEDDQMHRRAVQGRRLNPFVHTTGIVTMRIDGQSVDRGEPWIGDNHPKGPGREAGERFAARVQSIVDRMPAPVPGEVHEPKRGPGRPNGSGEGRDTPITWRTTAARKERLSEASARLGMPQSQALDAALDAWLKKHS